MEKINFLECDEFKKIKRLMKISDDATNFEMEIRADDPHLKISGEKITYKGREIILYIRDQPQYFGEKQTEYKFHVVGCATLKTMQNQGRADKYVISRRTSGIFKVNRIVDNHAVETEEKLHVCKNCLQKLNWQGYRQATAEEKDFICENFSIAEFFEFVNHDNERNFSWTPKHTAETARKSVYPPNWKEISRRLKEERNFICEECHKKFASENLHVHHKNGIKSDCSRANLEVLCLECHQKKHNHRIFFGNR